MSDKPKEINNMDTCQNKPAIAAAMARIIDTIYGEKTIHITPDNAAHSDRNRTLNVAAGEKVSRQRVLANFLPEGEETVTVAIHRYLPTTYITKASYRVAGQIVPRPMHREVRYVLRVCGLHIEPLTAWEAWERQKNEDVYYDDLPIAEITR